MTEISPLRAATLASLRALPVDERAALAATLASWLRVFAEAAWFARHVGGGAAYHAAVPLAENADLVLYESGGVTYRTGSLANALVALWFGCAAEDVRSDLPARLDVIAAALTDPDAERARPLKAGASPRSAAGPSNAVAVSVSLACGKVARRARVSS